MIQDDQQSLLASVPASGLYAGSTFGIDLNPDYGQGVSARKAPLLGMGDELLFRVDVAQSFAIGAGTPVAQFHVVLSDIGNGVAVHGGASVVSIGTQAPQWVNVGGVVYQGIVTADLTAGTRFFIRSNPWTKNMGRNLAGSVVIGKDLRYVGVMIAVPNYTGGTHAFSAGIISASLVKHGAAIQDPKDFIYPASVVNMG